MRSDPHTVAVSIVDEFLTPRLDQLGIPGLRDAAIDLVAEAFTSYADELMRDQFRLLNDTNRRILPDAYLADEAAAENALQSAAAGLRVALAQTGMLVQARSFERSIADQLRDDPVLALRAELARIPRPLTRPLALGWSIKPAPWFDQNSHKEGYWPPTGIDEAARSLPEGLSALARIDDGPYRGWTQIGMVERHRTPARPYPQQPGRQVLIMLGLEAVSEDPPPESLPFTRNPWKVWSVPWRQLAPTADPIRFGTHLSTADLPMTALTDGGHSDPSHHYTGLGTPPYVLSPALAIVAFLDLEPTRSGICGFSLNDKDGLAIVGRQWHGHLIHDGSFRPLRPAVEGMDLLIRPDLLDRLSEAVGVTRLQAGVMVSHSIREAPYVNEDE